MHLQALGFINISEKGPQWTPASMVIKFRIGERDEKIL